MVQGLSLFHFPEQNSGIGGWFTYFKERIVGLWTSFAGLLSSPFVAFLGVRIFWNTPNHFLKDEKEDIQISYACVDRLDHLKNEMVHGTESNTINIIDSLSESKSDTANTTSEASSDS